MPEVISDEKTITITTNERGTVFIFSKDVLPDKDGTKAPKKGEYATETTCSMFYLLQFYKVKTYFIKLINTSTFEARFVDMSPIEVTISRNMIDSRSTENSNEAPLIVSLFASSEPQTPAEVVEEMINNAKQAFCIMEQAWLEYNGKLQAVTFQFGTDTDGEMLIAGVINSDSWKLTFTNEQETNYSQVADLSYKIVSAAFEAQRIT